MKNSDSDHNDNNCIAESQESSTHDKNKTFKSNLPALIFYTLSVQLGALYFGWIQGECNQMYPVLNVLFDWDDDQSKRYSTTINTMAIVSSAISSIFGGQFMFLGRRRTLILNSVIGIIGSGICCIEHLAAICVGRFIQGFSAGLYMVLGPMILAEVVPNQLIGYLGTTSNSGVSLGILLSSLVGLRFQDADGLEAEEVNNFWRLVFMIPAAFSLLQILVIVFYFREETIFFCVSQNREEEAKRFIKKVYSKDESPDDVYHNLRQNLQNTGEYQRKVSILEIIFSKEYRFTTWIATSCFVFFQLTGISILIFYSTILLAQMDEEGDFALSPTVGTSILGVTNFCAACLAPLTVRFFGRKTLFVFGQFSSGICLLAIGFLQVSGNDIGVLVMMFLFVFFDVITIAPNTYSYSAEISGGQAVAVGNFVLQILALITSTTSQAMFDSALKPQGVFWLYGGFTIIGGIHHLLLMKEIRGLSIEEKLNLYKPKKIEKLEKPIDTERKEMKEKEEEIGPLESPASKQLKENDENTKV